MSCALECLDRRTFVLAAGVIIAGCHPTRWSAARLLEGRRLALAEHDLGEEGWTLIEAPGADAPLLVSRSPEGGFRALELRCTHRGCTVRVQRARLVCPCHGSEFAPDGEVVQGPATRALRRLAVTQQGTELVVALEGGVS